MVYLTVNWFLKCEPGPLAGVKMRLMLQPLAGHELFTCPASPDRLPPAISHCLQRHQPAEKLMPPAWLLENNHRSCKETSPKIKLNL